MRFPLVLVLLFALVAALACGGGTDPTPQPQAGQPQAGQPQQRQQQQQAGTGRPCRTMNEGQGESCIGSGPVNYGKGSCPSCSLNICCSSAGGAAGSGEAGMCQQAAICNSPRY